MFIDKVKVKVTSGAGGNGMVAWRKEKFVAKGGPAGGDGGKGGDVYLIADRSLATLLDFKYKSIFSADNGENGKIKKQHGKSGNDIFIKVPCGTIVKDFNSGKIIGDLVKDGQKLLVASGGRGGRGNARFVSSVKKAPQYCEPGEPGIERELEFELKLIADIGLLGFPNVGKSTLISAISAAKPKIADYPFTTLTPNLGVIRKPDGDGIVIADIPGLIEGASEGAGLGHEFLRHVERNRLLLHLLDLTEEDPEKNFETINDELKKYGGRLVKIPQIVVLNKIDAVLPEKIDNIKALFEHKGFEVFVISAATGQRLKELVGYMLEKIDKIPVPELDVKIEEDYDAYDRDDSGFIIYKDKKTFVVEGGKVERLVSITDLRNTDAVFRLQNIFKAMGVFKALKQTGMKDKDVIRIGKLEFTYYDDEVGEVNDEG